jgi:hypothetical protein
MTKIETESGRSKALKDGFIGKRRRTRYDHKRAVKCVNDDYWGERGPYLLRSSIPKDVRSCDLDSCRVVASLPLTAGALCPPSPIHSRRFPWKLLTTRTPFLRHEGFGLVL